MRRARITPLPIRTMGDLRAAVADSQTRARVRWLVNLSGEDRISSNAPDSILDDTPVIDFLPNINAPNVCQGLPPKTKDEQILASWVDHFRQKSVPFALVRGRDHRITLWKVDEVEWDRALKERRSARRDTENRGRPTPKRIYFPREGRSA